MTDIEEIVCAIKDFRDAREWEKYHNPKDLAINLNVEAGELLENFLWKSWEEVNRERVAEELADVFYSAFLLADSYNFNVRQIVLDKLEANADKYPIKQAKGNNKKYDEL